MDQELEQYLRFFVEHRQKNWPEWLATAEFAVNNKVHTATKVSPFMLQLKDLRVGQWEEPCIGLTQENLIESSVQDSLPYIPWTHGPC